MIVIENLKYLVIPAVISAAGVGGTLWLKKNRIGTIYEKDDKIIGKTVIVTGANSGIGKETAKNLAKRGGRVLMACRDMKKCEQARQEILKDVDNINVKCQELNLASCKSIRNFAKQINEEEDRLDVLINNAGVMQCPKAHTEEYFEWQLGVNYLGHFLLTNLLLDKLKQSPQGRVINLVNPFYKDANINFDDLNSDNDYNAKFAYHQSKLALVLFTTELARRLEGTNVTVNCVHPGFSQTEIGRHLIISKSSVAAMFMLPVMWIITISPFQAAQTSIYLAVSPDVEKVTGQYFENRKVKPIADVGRDEEVARRLWLTSEKWTRLT